MREKGRQKKWEGKEETCALSPSLSMEIERGGGGGCEGKKMSYFIYFKRISRRFYNNF